MSRLIKLSVLLLGLTVFSTQRASAFALAGPWESWMSAAWGYDNDPQFAPLSLGDEYRWNTPIITYGFDESFLHFFGSNGVAAVEAAMKIMNDLPPFSAMSQDLHEFPLKANRPNYRAAALGLIDLKSYVLGLLMHEIGLEYAENSVWVIRDDFHLPGDVPAPTVIMRNYDPVTLNASPYVNGVLYTYHIFHDHTANPIQVDAVEDLVDPLATFLTTVTSSAGSAGQYVNGLTRDDIGGLRYIYRRSNLHIENPPTGVTNGGFVFTGGGSSGGTGNGWFAYDPTSLTNATVIFPTDPGNWPYNPSTNSANTNLTGGGVGGGTNFVTQALRPGVDKLTFVRVDYESILGSGLRTNQAAQIYTDQYVTNGTIKTQTLTRQITRPDILFLAQDLNTANGIPVGSRITGADSTAAWVNNNTINGEAGAGIAQAGPGNIQGPISISLTRLYPYLQNIYPNFITEANATRGPVWASFDGSTNAPIVYPNGTDIRNLERQILGF